MISAIRSASPGSLMSISRAQQAYTKSVERLNVGNANEPDQVARSVKFEAKHREIIQQRLNQNQFRSLVQTADAALNEITPALYRLHEIAIRGLSTVIGQEERSLLHHEAKELESMINASVRSAQFNGRSLFDRDFNLQTLDDQYQLDTALNLDPLLETQVPNDDHEIVLIFDPSRSLTNVDELFTKVVEAAQRYKLKGGDVSIGIAFAPINLNNRPPQIPGPREMAYHPPVSVTEDPQGEHLASLQTFLDDYEFAVGRINFGEAISQVHDQTEWNEHTSQSIVIITTAGGEDEKGEIPDEIERFTDADPRRHVSAIGVPSANHASSTYFDQLIGQLDSGYYYDYSADLNLDDVVDTASGETRLISEVNMSSAFYAKDTLTVVEDALDKLSATRSQLGAFERRAEAILERHYSDELSVLSSLQREDQRSTQDALAQRVSSEFQLKRAVHFQRAEHANHWQRFLELVTAHT